MYPLSSDVIGCAAATSSDGRRARIRIPTAVRRSVVPAAAALYPIAHLVLDPHLALRWADRRGEALLRARDGLRLRRGRLLIDVPHSHARLVHLVAARAGSASDGAVGLTIPREHGTRFRVAISAGHRGLLGDDPRPCALLQIADPELAPAISESVLRDLYNLTAAEARLAALMGSGAALVPAATRLRISTGTARNYLKRIFAKTATGGQVELVSLLLRGPGVEWS